jgi:hypothetical protein
MNNVRSRDPFQYTRMTVWVSPSGESQFLDEVFHDIEDCVEVLLNGGVFKDKFLPDKKDETPETLAAMLEKLDIFDEIYVHVGKEEERSSRR